MTLSKLSLRNACRQARDYLVYFVTVSMVTALMYAFNGLIFSEEIQTLSKMLRSMTLAIILASIVVVCVISWLVSYTTKFMLTRRSRELGTYILIGLENEQVARLFFLENVAVGALAMVLGMILGNLIFQALRAIVLAMFGMGYHFAFSFSLKTVGLTLIYFVLIYLSVQFRSRRRIRTMKIYDLIYFEKQNEEAVIKKSSSRRRISVVSIVLGVAGTVLILAGNLFFGIVGAGCIIAFLYGFFASFSSGVPAWFEKHNGKKYQGQNLLVFRALSAKLATMGVVMATIAMLFTAVLIAEGTGMTFRAMFCNRAKWLSCFDLVLSVEASVADMEYEECMDYIRENIPVLDAWQYPIYLGDTAEVTDYIGENTEYYPYYPRDTVMKASDYAALRRMLGYPEVTMEPGRTQDGQSAGQYIIHCQPYVGEVLKDWSRPVRMGEYTLTPGGIYTETFAQYLWGVNGNRFILVVPDEAAEGLAVSHNIYAAKTAEPVEESQYEAMEEILDQNVYSGSSFMYSALYLYVRSAEEAEVAVMTAMTVFPLFYLALVLIMTAATILTIQQLDETRRYRQQYGLLYKLGMDRREMMKALRTQVAIYYTMPAIPPVLIGVTFVLNLGGAVEPGTLTGASHPLVITGMALGLFFLIYGVYILLAYTGLKRNVLPETCSVSSVSGSAK
ncbi:MAG: ABC transporter permease [Acetatifactor sp.]|nr:ABC transporter permease [Acetatifactor sp.]